jgi:hypothetical protein
MLANIVFSSIVWAEFQKLECPNIKNFPMIASRSSRYYEKRKIYRIRSLCLIKPLATGFTIVGPVQSGRFLKFPHTLHQNFGRYPVGIMQKEEEKKF